MDDQRFQAHTLEGAIDMVRTGTWHPHERVHISPWLQQVILAKLKREYPHIYVDHFED